ncbi:MAG: RuBisCO operon transcriptional regulator [Aeromicrobium sp.]|nr:RuBisCO operon transcriptional regulator [Aeromicrobium sp.]
MAFTLRQLSVFDVIAREGSVTRAAAELDMTQSAASMALKSLEEAVGRELFVRRGRRLVLGEHGRLIQPMARSILTAADEMERAVSVGAPHEELLIGASPTVAEHLLGDLVAEFVETHPQVRVNVATLPALEVIQRIDDMALDIGVIEMVTARPTVRRVPWHADRFVVFASPGHPLATGRPHTPAELSGQRWCLPPRLNDSRWQFAYRLMSLVDEIDIVLESDSTATIKAAVSRGSVLGCLPRPCVADELAAGTLVEIEVSDLDLRIAFSVLVREGLTQSPAHQEFVRRVTASDPSAAQRPTDS